MNAYQSIIVAGGKGMLAHALTTLLQKRRIGFVSVDYDTCDITQEASVAALFARYEPTLLINCAAHTKVDLCEQEEGKANAVNGTAVGLLAGEAKKHGTKMVHISTDFVFDGNGTRPYRPDDAPRPLSAYGRSKLLGERMLAEANPPGWIIARTAWLYGPRGLSFPRTIVERAKAGQPLKVVSDQVGSPTYTFDLAAAILALVDREASGIWHLTNSGQTNWFEFTQAIVREFGLAADVQPISSADWNKIRPSSAPRPAYSVLDNSAFAELTGRPMPAWEEGLRSYREEMRGAE